MSVREYAVLYLGKSGKPGASAGGGNVVLTGGGAHALDGPEHTTAGDSTRLDATTTAHGLLPKLSGDAADALLGDGTWGVVSGTPATTVTDETTWGITPAVGSDTEYARQDHTHGTPADPGSGSGAGEILVLDTPAGSPLVFTDLLQNEAGTDLLYQG